MTPSARVMVPVKITAGMLKASTTIPEPDTLRGESAWVASGTYVTGALKTHAGSIWICTAGHNGRAAAPGADLAFWRRYGPTNRMAPFDDYSSTKAISTGSMTYVIQPGFANGLAIYGMEGVTYSAVFRDGPGGAVLRTWSGDLYAQAAGFYELMFSPLMTVTQLSFDDIPLSPVAEVTITITSAPGQPVALGTIKVGDWRHFIGEGKWGGTQYGAQADRKTYTVREYNPDGTYQTIIRADSRNVSCNIAIDAEQAMYADTILGEIFNVAVPFEASGLPRYGYLNTMGFVTGSIQADSHRKTTINLKVEGNV